MNFYIFEKSSENSIRGIWLESDESGAKSVADILEMRHDSNKESLKNTVKCIYKMFFVGEQYDDIEKGYIVQVEGKDYDESLAGKARKQSPKDTNVITEQLWTVIV